MKELHHTLQDLGNDLLTANRAALRCLHDLCACSVVQLGVLVNLTAVERLLSMEQLE